MLIMHYWSTGGLPDDDRQLAAIARMSDLEWQEWRPIIQAFFTDGWKHLRIEFELTEAARVVAQAKAAGKASGLARRTAKQRTKTNGRSDTIEQRNQDVGTPPPAPHANGRPTPSPSPSHSIKKDARAGARGSDNLVLKEGKNGAGGPVRIELDTPQWRAWQEHLRKTTGKGTPHDRDFGWIFPSLWPPGHPGEP